MSLTKYESQVRTVEMPQETAFLRFSDMRNLGELKEKLNQPEVMEKLGEQLPEDKREDFAKYLENITFDEDSLSLQTPVGNILFRIVEREEPKLIKFQSEGSPLPLYLWIQLLPLDENSSKLRVTVGAEVSFFMKGMVAKPLQQAADGMAQILAAIK